MTDQHIHSLLESSGPGEVSTSNHNHSAHAFAATLAEDHDPHYQTAYTLQPDPNNIEPSFFTDHPDAHHHHHHHHHKRTLDDDDGSGDIATSSYKKQRREDSKSPDVNIAVVQGGSDDGKNSDSQKHSVFKENKPRAQKACDACRKSKSRCATIEETDPPVCMRCQNRGTACTWNAEPVPSSRRRHDTATVPYSFPVSGLPGQLNGDSSLNGVIDLSHISSAGGPAPDIYLHNPPQSAQNTELRDRVAAEEAEVERLSLVLRWKAAQAQKLKLQQQLAEHDGITTPPHLASALDPAAAAGGAGADVPTSQDELET